ncbi:phage tail tape measure protein, partial [Enterococcus faecium]
NTMGADMDETLRGVNGLMVNFGLSAQDAMDLMVSGTQNGLDKTHELGDNMAEYSQLWSQMGYSADETFGMLQNGLDAGAYNLDKVNDLVKEMGISLTDGRFEQNMDMFSESTRKAFEEWKNGGGTQKDVINSMIQDFSNMDGQYDQLNKASTIWSALGEDNAMKVVQSLTDVNHTFDDVS